MNIKTTTTPEDRREKLKKLREYQQPLLDAIGASDAYYIPKMAYRPIGKSEIYISFFPSEISKGVDIYTEFSSRDYIPEDAERRLYRWNYNAHYDEEYEKTAPAENGQFRYLIPVSELILVKYPEKKVAEVETSKQKEFELMDPNTDAPFDQLTVRDVAAILLKKPVSNKQWLNKLITDK
jgi:hypothetical protein